MDIAEVQVVVVCVADSLHHLLGHGLVLEQAHGDGVVLCQHVEGHVGGIERECHEGPLVLRHRLFAGEGVPGHPDLHAVIVADAEGEVRALRFFSIRIDALAQVNDGARLMPVQPEVHREVTFQEHRVHRLRLVADGQQLVGHVMLHFLAVELCGDDDVLGADVARHDVLVELYGHLVAVAQDAIRGRGCVEVARSRQVLDDGDDIAIDAHILVVVGRGGVGAELIRAFGVAGVALHVHGVVYVVGLEQFVAHTGGVLGAGPPGVQVSPLRVALEAVLHAHVLQVLELAVVVLQPHLQQPLLALRVEHRLVDGQVHVR